MFYNHNLKHAHTFKSVNVTAHDQPTSAGYYAVFILQKGHYVRHVIKAFSTQDASSKIGQMTGIFPASEKDVVGPLASSSHGYDKKTRDIWLNS